MQVDGEKGAAPRRDERRWRFLGVQNPISAVLHRSAQLDSPCSALPFPLSESTASFPLHSNRQPALLPAPPSAPRFVVELPTRACDARGSELASREFEMLGEPEATAGDTRGGRDDVEASMSSPRDPEGEKQRVNIFESPRVSDAF